MTASPTSDQLFHLVRTHAHDAREALTHKPSPDTIQLVSQLLIAACAGGIVMALAMSRRSRNSGS